MANHRAGKLTKKKKQATVRWVDGSAQANVKIDTEQHGQKVSWI